MEICGGVLMREKQAEFLSPVRGERVEGSKRQAMGRGGGPSTRALAPPAAVHARLTVNRVVWRPTWAIADHPQDHDPHPADQGLHFEQILGFWLSFCAIGNKNAGNAQQNAREKRLHSKHIAFFLLGIHRQVC